MISSLVEARVLVVEDETLLALDLEMTLQESGCRVVGPVATVADAIELIEASAPDAAVLDLNLNGESSLPIADALAARAIPYVFLTGYDREQLPERHRQAPVASKPYRTEDLLRMLDHVIVNG